MYPTNAPTKRPRISALEYYHGEKLTVTRTFDGHTDYATLPPLIERKYDDDAWRITTRAVVHVSTYASPRAKPRRSRRRRAWSSDVNAKDMGIAESVIASSSVA